jgi:hypothetical protein
MHIDDDQCLKSSSLLHIQIRAHKLHNVINLLITCLLIGLEAVFTLIFDGNFHISSPVDGVDSENNLTGPLSDPRGTRSVVVR